MENSTNTERDRILLEEIERDPDTTQATLAGQLGVAVELDAAHVFPDTDRRNDVWDRDRR